jgi:hypothetical protein
MYRNDQPTEIDKQKEKMIIIIVCVFCLILLGYWLISDLKRDAPVIVNHTIDQLDMDKNENVIKGLTDEINKQTGNTQVDEKEDKRYFEYETKNAFGE